MQDRTYSLSRRTFLGGAAALAASTMLPTRALAAKAGTPNSKFDGVQIGCITYSFRSMPSTAEDLLKYIVECGISSVELMGPPAEQYAKAVTGAKGPQAPMEGFQELRKLYNDAGVNIHIAKFGNIGNKNVSDEQIDYYFKAAKALGAGAITRELSDEAARRLGPMADKHEIMIGFHNHTQITPTTYDGDILSYGKFLGINLDIGHYVAANGQSPIPLIEKHADRIVSLHLKDRKKDNGPNMPLGEGDTPLVAVLQYMKKNNLKFPGDIELEYKIPKGSNAVEEVTKCVQFCKKALA